MALVTDHAYFGNVCSGFGGKLECQYFNMETGQRCGQDPHAHVTAEELAVLAQIEEMFSQR